VSKCKKNALLVADVHNATNGEALDAEKNLSLFRRVTAGDATAREEMIVGNMPLAVAKVESFVRCFPGLAHLRDDLTSAAFIGLTKAVNKMAAGRGPRKKHASAPVDFIGMWINRELNELMETEGIVPPHTSKARAQAQGDELTVPTVVNTIPEQCAVPSYGKEMEMRELIESCCTCDEERTLLAMREEGRTYAAIAAALGKAVTSVYVMRERLAARVRRKLDAAGDFRPGPPVQ
jgi:hypothetical protein